MSTPLSNQVLLDIMARDTIFAHLDEPVLRQLLAIATLKPFAPDDVLQRQGDEATSAFVLVQGRAKLTQVTLDGTQILMRYIGPGQQCDVMALLPGMTHGLTAHAMDAGQLLHWSSTALEPFVHTYSQIALNALRLLVQCKEELQRRYQELLTECVAQRLAHALLRLVAQAGHPVDEGILINLPLSREDLAQLAGTTLFTVSRTLSFWEHAGLIETGRGRVVILKMEEFEALASAIPD